MSVTKTALASLDSRSPQETHALGHKIAAHVRPGDRLLLSGNLGAGKTEFARGFITALVGECEVTSPTYTLVQVYPVRLQEQEVELWHVDLYRLDNPQQLVELGLEDEYTPRVLLVEWPEIMGELHGDEVLAIAIETREDGVRRLTFSGHARWRKIFD